MIKLYKIAPKSVKALIRQIINGCNYYTDVAKVNEICEVMYNDNNIFFVYYDENKPVSFLCVNSADARTGVVYPQWIGTLPEYRRKHLARILMIYMMNWCQANNIHKIWCDTRTNNKESISLMKKLKMKKLTILKNHWNNLDYILWEKIL